MRHRLYVIIAIEIIGMLSVIASVALAGVL